MQHATRDQAYQELYGTRLAGPGDAPRVFKTFAAAMNHPPPFRCNYAQHLSLIYDMAKDDDIYTLFPSSIHIKEFLTDILFDNVAFGYNIQSSRFCIDRLQERAAESFICIQWLFRLQEPCIGQLFQACRYYFAYGGRAGQAAALVIAARCPDVILQEFEQETRRFVIQQYTEQKNQALNEAFAASLSLYSYCLAFYRNITLPEYLLGELPDLANRQIKHLFFMVRARCFAQYKTRSAFADVLALCPDVYLTTLEAGAYVVASEGDVTMFLGFLSGSGGFRALELPQCQFLALILAFRSDMCRGLDEIAEFLEFCLRPRESVPTGFLDSLFFLIYYLARSASLTCEKSFFAAVQGLLLPILLFDEHEDVRLSAAACFQVIDGAVLHRTPEFCGMLKCEEMHSLEYCVDLFEFAPKDLRGGVDNYLEYRMKFQLAAAQKISGCYAGLLAQSTDWICTDYPTYLVGWVYLAAGRITRAVVGKLMDLNVSRLSLKDQFSFAEAASFGLHAALQKESLFSLCDEGALRVFLVKNVPFVCRYYFNDATLKDMRDDLRLETLWLFVDLDAVLDGALGTFADEYLATLALLRYVEDFDAIATEISRMQGASGIHRKVVFLNAMAAKLTESNPQLCAKYCALMLDDYTSDQRGDVGAPVRYRAFCLLARLAAKNTVFLYDFYRQSVYFAISRLKSFRDTALVLLQDVLRQCGADTAFLQTAGLPGAQECETVHFFDISELSDRQRRREQKQYLQGLENRQFEVAVALFKTKYPQDCIRALLYAAGGDINKRQALHTLLCQNFSEAVIDGSIRNALSHPEGFYYHLAASSVCYLAEREAVGDDLLLALLDFCKLKQLPAAKVKECLWVFFTAAMHNNLTAAKCLFLALGHRIGGARDCAANMLTAWMLRQQASEDLIAQFCHVKWADLGVQELKTARVAYMRELNIIQ